MFKVISKIFFVYLPLSVFCFNFLVCPVKAANDYQLSTFATAADYSTKNISIEGTTQNILKVALSIMGILFLAFALYAGIRWMTAQGNEEHVTRAKDTMEAAVIGLAIVAASYAITTLIFQKIGA
ncbi:MAG: hypothetical protein HY979_02170 [Candidatus Magasanikbacteria bacterium]|nr:hypothetical protein [Candidatus Magasanikbacteria bacterium]